MLPDVGGLIKAELDKGRSWLVSLAGKHKAQGKIELKIDLCQIGIEALDSAKGYLSQQVTALQSELESAKKPEEP